MDTWMYALPSNSGGILTSIALTPGCSVVLLNTSNVPLCQKEEPAEIIGWLAYINMNANQYNPCICKPMCMTGVNLDLRFNNRLPPHSCMGAHLMPSLLYGCSLIALTTVCRPALLRLLNPVMST